MKIIGITGTLGAGKGTVVEYLRKEKGFAHYSVRDYLTHELQKRNLPVDRQHMTLLANELRAQHSPDFIIRKLYAEALAIGRDAVIESVRTPGEAEFLKSKDNFYLLAVDADEKSRYQRILSRNSETDHVSFEEFQQHEALEMNSTDPNKQNLSKCIKRADFVLNNDGTKADLDHHVDEILKKI